jgi:hypothetical protein
MVWKPGQSGNLNGRPKKYQATEDMTDRVIYHSLKIAAIRDEYRAIAEAQDLEDPVLFQHRLLSDETIPKPTRAAIALGISQYYRPRLGVMEPAKYVQTPIEVPEFQSIEDAEAFLLQLAQRVAAQELDTQSVAEVSARVLDWVRSKRAGMELDLKMATLPPPPGTPIHFVIEGGLPPLPGTNVTMPEDKPPKGTTFNGQGDHEY